MGYPTNPELLQAIVSKGFYDAASTIERERLLDGLALNIPQDKLTEIYVSFGSVPEPTQLSGKSAGKLTESKELKDYKLTITMLEWEDTVDMPRVVLESNPGEGQRVASMLGMKTALFFDKRCFIQFVNNPVGYDGVALFGSTHPESGTNQVNDLSTNIAATATPFLPTVTEFETSMTAMVAGIKKFTDDQGTPVNEAVTRFTCYIPPSFEWFWKSQLDPKMAGQAIDASGGKGAFRGVVDYKVSAFCTSNGLVSGNEDRFYMVADNGRTKPLGYFNQLPWEVKTNIGTDDPNWTQGHLALMYGYSIWEIGPWDWKSVFRQVYT